MTDRIQRIKAALLALGDLRPGACLSSTTPAAPPAAAAKPTRPSATAHELSYSHHGKSRTSNIRPETHHHGHLQIANYQAARPHRPMDRHRIATGPPPTPPTPEPDDPTAGAASLQTNTSHPAPPLKPQQYRAFRTFDAHPPRSWSRSNTRIFGSHVADM